MKRSLCLILALLLAFSLLPAAALASDEAASEEAAEEIVLSLTYFEEDDLRVTYPAPYDSGNGVVNGYYAETAPIVLFESPVSNADYYAGMGCVVVEAMTDDLAAAAEAAVSGKYPGDPGRLVVIGSNAAAELAADSGIVYAAVITDPIVDAEYDADAVAEELNESLDELAMTYATVTVTESTNTTTIDDEAKAELEDAYGSSAEMNWSEASAEPTISAAQVTLAPNDWGVPADAAVIEPDEGAADYVYIYWNLKNENGSYGAAHGLAEAFEAAGSTVGFTYLWQTADDEAHAEQIMNWIDRVCKVEHEFTEEQIETTLDLANVLSTGDAQWTYNGSCYILTSDLHIGVVDVARPELPDYQGVSVAVPAAYVNGINEDGTLDINWDAEITNSNGMTYTAATAPIVMQTGATGYSVKANYTASTGATTGYITVEPGNRGKYSRAYDAEGHVYYTGDAPLCSTDQKSTVRWLRYNVLNGNIPGDADRIVTWGGSGGGAHSTLICAGDSPYYAEYLYANGALGVEYTDGEYTYLDGFSDSVWGSCPGGAVTNLEEANMLYEFETWLSSPTDEVLMTLDDGTPIYVPTNIAPYSQFYRLLSYYMVMQFIEYFNAEGLTYDVDGDGEEEVLEVLYDPAGHPETNGLYGNYVDLFLDSAEAQLEWAMDNIEAANYDWELEDGESMVDAFLHGHYTYTATGGGPDVPSGPQQGTDLTECLVSDYYQNDDGTWTAEYYSVCAWEDYRGRSKTPLAFDAMNYCTENEEFGDADADYRHWDKYCLAAMTEHYDELAAAYDADADYESFEALYNDFANDCIEITLGQAYSGQVTEENINAVLDARVQADGETVHDAVWIYNPMRLFLDGTATLPTWVWTVTGAADSDSSNLVTMNDAIALTMGGTDASFAWTWGAGHGSNTPLNTSQNGTIDAMMAKYAE